MLFSYYDFVVSIVLLFTEAGKPIGRVLYEMNTARSRRFPINIGRSRRYTINIDKPSDSKLVSEVKKIIKEMIVYKPDGRISMKEVVKLLTLLRDSISDEVDSVSNDVLLAVNARSVWVRVASGWEMQYDMPEEQPVEGTCFCGVPDGIVVIGGGDARTVSSVCHHFSVITHKWKRLPDMPTARCVASAVVVRHMLMVLGGRDKRTRSLAACEGFHLTDGVWSSVASMMKPALRPLVAVAVDGVYIVQRSSCISPGHPYACTDPEV